MARKSKGSVAPQGKYAQIPVSVSKAVLADLSATEFRVWFALCMQCQHWSNGTGKLCRSVIREFHLGSQRNVTAATKQLIAGKQIVMTRAARQRRCALYGVTFLALNTDAMAKEGLDASQIRKALHLHGEARFSASNRGSANSATTLEALNSRNDNRGSAKPGETPLALPQGKRIGAFSTPLALPHRNTSKRSTTPPNNNDQRSEGRGRSTHDGATSMEPTRALSRSTQQTLPAKPSLTQLLAQAGSRRTSPRRRYHAMQGNRAHA